MRRNILIIVLCLGILAMSAQAVLAADDLFGKVLEKGELVIATDMTAIPMQFRDKDGNPTGFTVELMELMGQKLGVKIKWVDYQWESLIPSLLSSKVDMIAANMSMTLERMKTIRFSNQYFLTGISCVARKDSKLESWEELDSPDITIGTTMGSVHADFIEKNMKAKASLYDNRSEYLTDLKNGRVDAVMDDEIVCMDIVKAESDIKFLKGLVRADTYGLTFRQGSETDRLVEWVNNYLLNVKLMGDYGQLYEKWFGKKWEPSWID
ncbi:MAG: ABC transporter substrate-binding protein [Atribacterota bacterium]|nr:ABC transporter substrate-binding protein [Atribacterota bacterium]